MTIQAKQQLLVFWVLWGAFQVGVFMMYLFLSNGAPAQAPEAASSLWLAGAAPVALSAVMRWIALPRLPTAQAALPLFIVGIATAEATCFLGLFVFPAHQQELFILSALGIAQFIPLFACRYFPEDGGDQNG